MEVINQFVYNNKTYYVFKDYNESCGIYYGTIDSEYIKDGKLIKALNGFETLIMKTYEGAITKRKVLIDIANEYQNRLDGTNFVKILEEKIKDYPALRDNVIFKEMEGEEDENTRD